MPFTRILLEDQREHFKEVHGYFDSIKTGVADVPTIVGQLNLFRDEVGLLRVKAKFKRWIDKTEKFPILLSKDSTVYILCT